MSMEVLDWSKLDAGQRRVALRRAPLGDGEDSSADVADIIRDVRENGDNALRRLSRKFDAAVPNDFRVSQAEFDSAEAEVSADVRAAMELAIRNVRTFHEAQRPQAIQVQTMPGINCERLSHPIESVGLYVPAGTAPLPSAAIMLAVPAAIAGCTTRIMCTPPQPDGSAHPAVLVAARLAGVTDVYKIGGAQAIAAMAYGTESVPGVDKIFGPGNAWVTLAKTLVSTDPEGAAIDMPAGPSEVLVIADAKASARFVAADLLSQAEHGADSQAILVTPSPQLAAAVVEEIEAQLGSLSRADIARQALVHCRAILVADLAEAISISNEYAPEHLILQTESPRDCLPAIRNAGSIFVGQWSPEAVGDYCSGTNHVLPTYGFARSYSGLGVDQFLRQMTVQELSVDGLLAIADSVIELAELEGLDAHSAAVAVRLETLQ